MNIDEMTLTEINEVGTQWADMMGAYWTVRAHCMAHARLNAHIRNVLRSKGVEANEEAQAQLAKLDASIEEMKELARKTKAQCDDLAYWYERATPKGFPGLTTVSRSRGRS